MSELAGLSPLAIATALRAALDDAEPRLRAIDATVSAVRPAPGKWSAREIVGHLIDSAQNNHGRFVRAQLTDDLVFPGYAQEEWVRLQRYQEAEWTALVTLLVTYNRHLARVIEAVEPAIASQPRARHNLHELAWRPLPAERPATLGSFFADYVAHLHHHLAQVWAATARGERREEA